MSSTHKIYRDSHTGKFVSDRGGFSAKNPMSSMRPPKGGTGVPPKGGSYVQSTMNEPASPRRKNKK